MPINIDNTGLTTQTLSEIHEERETELQGFLGSDFEIQGDSLIGNLQASDADREFAIQELIKGIYNAMSLQNSTGSALDNNALFKNQKRLSKLRTVITRTINGVAGTTITAKSLTIRNQNNNYDFELASDVVIGMGGTVQAQFQTLFYENVVVNNSDVFVITTPIAGVTSITFETGDGVLQSGRQVESDEEFKARILNSNTVGSTALSEAIVAKIRQLDNVEFATYLENKSSINYMYEDYVAGTGSISTSVNSFTVTGSGTNFLTELDANYSLKFEDDASDEQTVIVSTIASNTSLTAKNKTTTVATTNPYQYAPPTLPPNSFEIIVLGGVDTDIAQVILDNKVPTTMTVGNSNAIATDSEGQSEVIYFTRPTEIDVVMQMDVYYTSVLTTDEQNTLKTALVNYWNGLKSTSSTNGIGLDMDADDFAQVSNQFSKIRKIRNIEIKKSGNISFTDYIEIKNREIAMLATGDITLNLIAV